MKTTVPWKMALEISNCNCKLYEIAQGFLQAYFFNNCEKTILPGINTVHLNCDGTQRINALVTMDGTKSVLELVTTCERAAKTSKMSMPNELMADCCSS